MTNQTPADVMYQEALGAIRGGERARARDLLTRLIKQDPNQADYWTWMSAVVDTQRERIFCLQSALQCDPANEMARRGLVLMGALPPGDAAPVALRRKWQSLPTDLDGKPLPPVNAFARTLLPLGAAILVLVIIGGVLLAKRPARQVARVPANTLAPSATYLPSTTPVVRTATPTFTGPTPLWMQLAETYTPTPLAVNTPHPRTEAYRSGLTRYQRGDLPAAVNFFEQVTIAEPDAADAFYYLGEIARQQGKYEPALARYDQSIKLNPTFAAAYLGRARAAFANSLRWANSSRPADIKAAQDARDQARADLQKAVELDGKMLEAHLETAALALADALPEDALDALSQAEAVDATSPFIPYYRSQAYLLQGDSAQAVEQARAANQADFTMLPAYLQLGAALQADGQAQASLSPLHTYTLYIEDNPAAWVMLGRAYEAASEDDQAQAAYDAALELDEASLPALLARADLRLRLEQGEAAASDYAAVLKLDAKSFEASLGVARAYLLQGFKQDAVSQLNRAANLAESDGELAQVLYWRAAALEAAGSHALALKDWAALLALPEGAAPAAWLDEAAQQSATATPTASATPNATATLKATATPTPKPTVKATVKP